MFTSLTWARGRFALAVALLAITITAGSAGAATSTAPTGLKALSVKPHSIRLGWNGVKSAVSYRLYRGSTLIRTQLDLQPQVQRAELRHRLPARGQGRIEPQPV